MSSLPPNVRLLSARYLLLLHAPFIGPSSLDLPGLRIAYEISLAGRSHANLSRILYRDHEQGAWALQGLIREALRAPYSVTRSLAPPVHLYSSSAVDTLAALDSIMLSPIDLTTLVNYVMRVLIDYQRPRLLAKPSMASDMLRAIADFSSLSRAHLVDPDLLAGLVKSYLLASDPRTITSKELSNLLTSSVKLAHAHCCSHSNPTSPGLR